MTQKTSPVELNVDGETSQNNSAWHGIVAMSKMCMIIMNLIAGSTVLLSVILVSMHYK